MSDRPPANVAAQPDPELEAMLRLAQSPRGSDQDVRERERAATWLLAHPAVAYPALLAEVRENGSPRRLELLGRFDRRESTALLTAALGSDDPAISQVAGAALGHATDPDAAAAITQALASAEPARLLGGLEGARARAGTTYCTPVAALAAHSDAEIRWMAVKVGAELGCLDRTRLAALATTDPDADVRKLATELSRP